MTAKSDLETLIRSARSAETPPLSHPSRDRLLAVVDGEVSGEEAEELREHLALCRRCQAIVRVERFASPAAEEAAQGESSREPSGVLEGKFGQARPQPPRRFWPGVAAAAAAAAVILGSLWLGEIRRVESLERRLSAARMPSNVGVRSLLPRGFTLREGRPEASTSHVVCQPDQPDLILILLVGSPALAGKEFRAVLTREGIELWRSSVAASPKGTVDLRLPSGFLEAGKFELRLEESPGGISFTFDLIYDCPSP